MHLCASAGRAALASSLALPAVPPPPPPPPQFFGVLGAFYQALTAAGIEVCHGDEDTVQDFQRTLHVFGSGTYGKVFLAFRRETSGLWRPRAVKTLFIEGVQESSRLLDIAREAGREMALSARAGAQGHVAAICRGWFEMSTSSLFMEMDPGREGLHTFMQANCAASYSMPLYISLCLQCALAMQEVHRAGVVHRDVKPANFILSYLPYDTEALPLVRVCDFGLSCAVNDPSAACVGVGTHPFMAPECVPAEVVPPLAARATPPAPTTTVRRLGGLVSAQQLVQARDVYSLGVTLFQLTTGMDPLFERGEDGTGVPQAVMPRRHLCGRPFSREARAVLNVVALMLLHDPADRPPIDSIVECLQCIGVPPLPDPTLFVRCVRRMRVCRQDASLALFCRPADEPESQLRRRLAYGESFFAEDASCGDLDGNHLSDEEEERDGAGEETVTNIVTPARPHLATPPPSPPPRPQPTRLYMPYSTQWLHVVYPCVAYCHRSLNGRHIAHTVCCRPTEDDAAPLCSPLYSPFLFNLDANNEPERLAWEDSALLQGKPLFSISSLSSTSEL